MRKLLQLNFLSLFGFIILCFTGQALAQGVVSGTVTDADSDETLIGVNVLINELELGMPTDADGQFEFSNVPAGEYQLEARYVGFNTVERSITVEDGQETVVDIEMTVSTAELDELVVTSFGLEQERKALGYSVQEISSENLTIGNQSNVVSALGGKVSGVQVTNTGGSPGSSSRIVIRGINSLDPGADNQPLFVVDGVPIDNSTIESTGTPRNMSNRAADLNPNDIESVNVLKGAAATALYGVRAANGAVIVTTKGGQAGDTQINYTSTVGFDRVNKFPEFQDVYGQGFEFQNTPADGFWPNWGPRYEDTDAEYHDIWRDATQTGVQLDNSINISGGNEMATYYASVSNLQQEGVLPYGDWDRTSVRLSGDVAPRENFRVRSSINYVNSGGMRVLADRFMESMMYWSPNADVTDFEKEDGTMRGYYNDGSSGNNPIYQAKYWTYEDNVNRVIGNVTFDYNPAEWFNVLYTLGADFYSDQRTEIIPGPRGIEGENVVSSTGAIEETRINSRDINSTLNLTFQRDITERINTRLRVGNDIFDRDFNNVISSGNDFVTPLFYHLSNVRNISLNQQIRQRRLVGVYGDLLIDYDNFLYVNLTGRNDWSSTLPEDNRSFFYPSVSVGFSFSDIMDLPEYFTFGKLRASLSQVGKDAPVYSTSDTYNTPPQYPLDGRVGFTRSNIRGSEDLKPEQTTSLELGTDLRFFDNRLGVDFTWYQSNSKDQIFAVPISEATGYSEIITNAGEIENKGFEIQLTGRPVQMQDFAWDVTVNYSRNQSTVVEVAEGIEQILVGSSFGYVGSGASIQLTEGDPYGNIYGRSYERYYPEGEEPENPMYLDEDAPLLIGDDGFPVTNTDQLVLGNTQPDWIGSINNSFSYRNLNFSFLIDAKWGQDVYSQYDNFFTAFGITENTLDREDFRVFEGVTADGEPNTQEVWLGQGIGPDGVDYGAGYHRNVKRTVTEEFVFDASYIKLRNIRLAYSLPQNLISDIGFRNITLSATATNIILYTPFEGFDPESRAGGAGSNADGFTNLDYPGVSSFFFSVNLSL
ncbi:MAG: SusC/RagA family TonB-linked outer membrane protein [Balneolaceae bacterium]